MFNDEAGKRARPLTQLQAKTKAEAYCAYQERSQEEVRQKLHALGVYDLEAEEIIADLISEDFLNEERFAESYVSGKFRMKSWGRYKIRKGLMQKGVPPKLIESALRCIDADDYYRTLEKIMTSRNALLREGDPYKRKAKLAQYAAAKGYENDLIFDILNTSNLDPGS